MEYSEILKKLSASTLFVGVEMEPLENVLRSCKVVRIAPNEPLIELGIVDDSLYVVLEGTLEIHVDTSENDPIAHIGPGESVGEISALDHRPRSAAVVAKEATVALRIESEVFWTLMSRSHQIALNMLSVLGERLRGNNAKIIDTQRLRRIHQRNASTDPLTQLLNRRGLDELGERLIKRLAMKKVPLSLMMIDVDHFKRFNDTHGHPAGDFVLFVVGTVIKNGIRPTDFAARYGGEEFTVLLPETPLSGALVAAERVRDAVRTVPLSRPDGPGLPSVTASLGVAQWRQGETLTELIARADQALYEAKREGRDRVVAHSGVGMVGVATSGASV